MALFPQGALEGGRAPRHGLLALLPVLALSAGCLSLGGEAADGAPPPAGAVHQVVSTWQPHVVYAADPTHGGTPGPGLAGRLYLFGPEIGYPLGGDGSLVIDLYDASDPARSGVLQERWNFDPQTLKTLLRRDMIGWGYTLFLPWGSYRTDVTRVQLRVRYQPAKGAPIYAECAPLTLAGENGKMVGRQSSKPLN